MSNKRQLPFYFRMSIAVMYVILGLVLVTTEAGVRLTGKREYGLIFGVLCLMYGLFRFVRNQKNWDRPEREA